MNRKRKRVLTHHIPPDPSRTRYLIDFGDIKLVTRALCKELNERFLCPTRSDVIQIDVEGPRISLACEDGALFVLPTADCAMLPVVHSTAEELAQYFWHRLTTSFSVDRLLSRGIHTLQIMVAEAPKQEGCYTRRLTSPPLSFLDEGVRGRAAEVLEPKPCIGRKEVGGGQGGDGGKEREEGERQDSGLEGVEGWDQLK